MSSANSAVAAAAVFRSNTLFVQYSTAVNNFGTLFAIYPPTASSSSLPSSSSLSSLSASSLKAFRNGVSGVVNASVNNTLLIQPQNIFNNGANPLQGQSPSSTCMVSTSTQDPITKALRHDLFLAYNMPQSPNPLVLRFSSQLPNIGNGGHPTSNSSSVWTLSDQTQALGIIPGVSHVWLASGVLSGSGQSSPISSTEGSGLYELITLSKSNTIAKLDVSSSVPTALQSLDWPFAFTVLDTSPSPIIIRLTDNGQYDVMIFGSCKLANPSGSCFLLKSESTYSLRTSDVPYDPSSCITTTTSGLVIIASTTGISSFPYNSQTATWTNRQPPGILPYLPSPILTCTVANSTLYAVLQGNSGMPSIRVCTIDPTSTSWNWQPVQLVAVSSNNTSGTAPGSEQGNGLGNAGAGTSGKGTSITIIVVIVVIIVALLALLGILLFCRRRRQKKNSSLRSDDGSGKTYVVPAPVASSPSAFAPAPTLSPYAVTYPPMGSPGPTTLPASVATVVPGNPGIPMLAHSAAAVVAMPSPFPVASGAPPPLAGTAASVGTMPPSQQGVYAYQPPSAYNPPGQPYSQADSMASSNAPRYPGHMVYSTNRPTYQTGHSFQSSAGGDKQELVSEDQQVAVPSFEQARSNAPANAYSNQGQGSSTRATEAMTAAPPTTITREMMSPGLSNAQLILLRAQTPQNEHAHPTLPQQGNYHQQG